MVALVALKKVLKSHPTTGEEMLVQKGSVFTATPDEAKQLDKIAAARSATAEEIAAHKVAVAAANGTNTSAPAAEPSSNESSEEAVDLPVSGADKDPRSPPKGKAS